MWPEWMVISKVVEDSPRVDTGLPHQRSSSPKGVPDLTVLDMSWRSLILQDSGSDDSDAMCCGIDNTYNLPRVCRLQPTNFS